MRKVSDTIVYSWPQDIIDETIKAYSTSATTATGYGALGAADGRYFAPANGPDCIETITNDYGDCGVRSARRHGTDVRELRPESAQADPITRTGRPTNSASTSSTC